MSRLNKNFSPDQRVSIHWPGTEIDGLTGSILGCSTRHIADFYIILLDTPLPGDRAIVLPEGCIEPIGPRYQALADANQRAADIVQTAVTAMKPENGPGMPQDTRLSGDPTSDAPDDRELTRTERDTLFTELQRLRALVGRLQDWAIELETPQPNAYQKSVGPSVGPFIAAELRRRLRGQ